MIYKHRTKLDRVKLAFSIYWNHTKELLNNLGQIFGLYDQPVIPTGIDIDTTSTALSDSNAKKYTWTNVYTTFSGSDIAVSFDGKIYGSLLALNYDINPVGNTGIMDLDFISFDDGNSYPPNNSTMIICCANEYGRQAYQVFELFDCTEVVSGFNIDAILPTLHAKFNCTGTGKYIQTTGKIFDMDEHGIITTVWEKLENTVNEKERDILISMRGRRIRFCEKCYLDYLINKHGFKFPEEE